MYVKASSTALLSGRFVLPLEWEVCAPTWNHVFFRLHCSRERGEHRVEKVLERTLLLSCTGAPTQVCSHSGALPLNDQAPIAGGLRGWWERTFVEGENGENSVKIGGRHTDYLRRQIPHSCEHEAIKSLADRGLLVPCVCGGGGGG